MSLPPAGGQIATQPGKDETFRRQCVFSVDVEDWFHILDLPSAPGVNEWSGLPSRVERNFLELLDLFESNGAKVTCFFLGWVAERFPGLVQEAMKRGHEIASHGYSHGLVYRMTRLQFVEDTTRTADILQQITGAKVWGYRAPGFSCTEEVPWFFEALAGAGYGYDSSVFPASRAHGGMRSGTLVPGWVRTAKGDILEFPITVASALHHRFCLFGGGYLRLFPYALVNFMAKRILRQNRPVFFYLHPREIDPSQPRLPMPRLRRFKCYVNLNSTREKVAKILQNYSVTTFKESFDQYLQNHD